MSFLKKFYAPALELLAWDEFVSILQLTLVKAWRGYKLFLKRFWWTMPFLLMMFIAKIYTILPALYQTGMFPIKFQLDLFESLAKQSAVATFVLGLCYNLFFFIALLLLRPSRDPKDWNYFAGSLNVFFIPSLVLLPIFSMLLGFDMFLNIWVLSMLFFIDSDGQWPDLMDGVIRGCKAFVRFFPVIFILQSVWGLINLLGLMLFFGVYQLGSMGFFDSLITIFSPAVQYVILGIGGLFFLFLYLMPFLFIPCALLVVLYVKVVHRYRWIFFNDSLT